MLYVSYLFLAATAPSKRRRGLAVDAAAPIVTVLGLVGGTPAQGWGGRHRAGLSVPVAAAPGILGRPSTAPPIPLGAL